MLRGLGGQVVNVFNFLSQALHHSRELTPRKPLQIVTPRKPLQIVMFKYIYPWPRVSRVSLL
jgi:hypothetical protein